MNVKEWVKQEQGKHFCACGCGGEIEIKEHHRNRGVPKFIHNHYTKVYQYNKIECPYSKEELYNLYWIENKTMTEIAKMCNVSRPYISKCLREYKIKIKTMSFAQKGKKSGKEKIKCFVSKEELYNLYWIENKTINEISIKFNVSNHSIYNWLNDFKIKIKDIKTAKGGCLCPITKEELYNLHKIKKMSCVKIGKLFNVSPYIVTTWLKEYNILIMKLNEYIGVLSSNWQGGISFEPYCQKFNNQLKKTIRNNYYRKCALCGKPETNRKHSVHHIDYDKSQGCNGQDILMVPLCTSCHGKTSGKAHRQYYEDLLTKIELTRIMIVEYESKIDYRSI